MKTIKNLIQASRMTALSGRAKRKSKDKHASFQVFKIYIYIHTHTHRFYFHMFVCTCRQRGREKERERASECKRDREIAASKRWYVLETPAGLSSLMLGPCALHHPKS